MSPIFQIKCKRISYVIPFTGGVLALTTAFLLTFILPSTGRAVAFQTKLDSNRLSEVAIRQAKRAPTPPMGWNSYNCYGSTVTEEEVKENAAYMAANLRSAGWQYIVVDYCWSYPSPPKSKENNVPQFRFKGDGAYVPWLAMDSFGRLMPDERKFPSSRDGKGFKPLGDYLHGLGLKFGIHVMRGVPRQAIWAKSKIFGTVIPVTNIADTSTCPWLNHMFGVDMKANGSQAYYNSLLSLYASWGVDLIKVDDIARPYRELEVEGYQKAIEQCGRPMVLSISPGKTPLAKATHVSSFANQWRMDDDFWDNWKALKAMFTLCSQWYPQIATGHFPDCDMLTLGKLSKRGPVGKTRMSRFTEDEQRTHMTLWCIFRSPLMMGGNMPENTEFVNALLTNKEAIEVNQVGENVRPLKVAPGLAGWTSRTPGKGVNIALFNLSDSSRKASVLLSSLGLRRKMRAYDIWNKSTESVSVIEKVLAPHACFFATLSKRNK